MFPPRVVYIMNTHLDDLRSLIATACDASVSSTAREGAERKILEIQRSPDTWKIYIELLQNAEDSILFFIGQGLKYAALKYWHHLSPSEQKLFTDKVLYCLLTRGTSLMAYSKSKIEQVVSTICIQRGSVSTVLDFLNASSCTQTVAYYASMCAQQGCVTGAGSTELQAVLEMLLVNLSLIRTVVEDVCTAKTGGMSQQQSGRSAAQASRSTRTSAIVEELVASYASTYVDLACGACAICYHSYYVQFRLDRPAAGAGGTFQGEYNSKLSAVLLQGVQCLRAIIAHVPIGRHLSSDVFDLLVRLASLGGGDGGAGGPGPDSTGCSSPGMLSWSSLNDDCASPAATVVSMVTSSLSSISSLAIDTLSELLWLKYLPTTTTAGVGTGTSAVVDSSIPVLMTLVSAVTKLLSYYRVSYTRDVPMSFAGPVVEPSRTNSGLSIITTNMSHEWEDMPTVLALVAFIAAFVQCHLERCVKFATAGARPGSDPAVSEASGSLCVLLLTMLQELQRLTIQARSATLVTKLAGIWKDIIELLHTCEGSVLLELLFHSRAQTGVSIVAVWSVVVRHLLYCSLFQHNSFLMEDLDEATDDLVLYPYVDSNIKAAVGQFDYNAGAADRPVATGVAIPRDEDAEDGSAVLALLKATASCIVSNCSTLLAPLSPFSHV